MHPRSAPVPPSDGAAAIGSTETHQDPEVGDATLAPATDVLLCYRGRYRDQVAALAMGLRAQGLKVTYDREILDPPVDAPDKAAAQPRDERDRLGGPGRAAGVLRDRHRQRGHVRGL